MIRICKVIAVIFAVVSASLYLACSKSSTEEARGKGKSDGIAEPICSVRFLDVGEGDCTVFRFPDGKTLMIDCGEKTERNIKSVRNCLEDLSVSELNWLLLSNVNSDHIGNAVEVIKRYKVGKAFIPDVHNKESFASFSNTVDFLEENNVETEVSKAFTEIKGENYHVVILSPFPSNISTSSYYTFNLTNEPSARECNDISPVVFVECLGVKFLFTGDISANEEKKVCDNFRLGFYSKFGVDIKDVNFLKVSHHGDEDASCSEFLEVVKPENAIISVGGDNRFSHPSSFTLLRLETANPEYKLFRTDRDGFIEVSVNAVGNFSVKTESSV